jgi:hypothetical protein
MTMSTRDHFEAIRQIAEAANPGLAVTSIASWGIQVTGGSPPADAVIEHESLERTLGRQRRVTHFTWIREGQRYVLVELCEVPNVE